MPTPKPASKKGLSTKPLPSPYAGKKGGLAKKALRKAALSKILNMTLAPTPGSGPPQRKLAKGYGSGDHQTDAPATSSQAPRSEPYSARP